VGHLGKDPEVRHLDGGVTVASFPLATSETYTKDGKKIEQTEWHNIVMWRGLADIASKYLQKGKLVYIEGKLRTRSFEDKEGHKKYTTEIVAENFTMLGRKSDFEGQGENNQQKLNEEHGINSIHIIAKEDQPMNYDKGIDDDLPF
jgi:single-strand DNA-binding protein